MALLHQPEGPVSTPSQISAAASSSAITRRWNSSRASMRAGSPNSCCRSMTGLKGKVNHLGESVILTTVDTYERQVRKCAPPLFEPFEALGLPPEAFILLAEASALLREARALLREALLLLREELAPLPTAVGLLRTALRVLPIALWVLSKVRPPA